MNLYYNIKDLGLITCYVFQDMLTCQPKNRLRKNLSVDLVNFDGTHFTRSKLSKKIYKGEFQDKTTGKHYMTVKVNDEIIKVFFEDFFYYSYETILEMLKNKVQLPKELILSTFLKETNKVAAIIKSQTYSTITTFGFATLGHDTVNVLCIPKETECYKKEDWHYKMSFVPYDENASYLCSGITTYTQTIIDLILDGKIKLVDKKSYINNWIKEADDYIKKYNKKFFKKSMNLRKIVIPIATTSGIHNLEAFVTELLEDNILTIFGSTK